MPESPFVKYSQSFMNWSKIILPYKKLRYYPPSFILRNPVLEGVDLCFKKGHQAAVIVFNPTEHHSLNIKPYQNGLKDCFKQAILQVFTDENIISLHNHSSDGHALIIKVHQKKKESFFEIEGFISEILTKVMDKLAKKLPGIQCSFETGYMFIEESNSSTREAIERAYHQANAMAEKRIHSKYNDLLFEMTRIINNKDIQLLAQPIIDVSTKQIKAWEILSRGPKGTSMESPLQLFSIARQTNLLFDLELIVLEKSFQQIIKTGTNHLVFINFTPITLGSKEFIKATTELLHKYPEVDPYKIIIEITERDSIEGYKYFAENIKALRLMGFRIAVDDTGAGYSSLHTISEVLPDIIKIDRSVIKDIDTNSVKESMLKGLLLIAKETGSIVVAEGIEKEGEATVLSRNNVDLAQGYFYAKPDILPSVTKTVS